MSMIGYNPALLKQLSGDKKKQNATLKKYGYMPSEFGTGQTPAAAGQVGPPPVSQRPAPAASPVAPGLPVYGPATMSPAQINSARPAGQRIAELSAQEATLRRQIVNPTIDPVQRQLAKERLNMILPEKQALASSQAPGPRFVDAATAQSGTVKLYEQTLAQLKDQIGRPEVDQKSLETRYNNVAAELEKAKSANYATEYNAPDRVASREAALQKHAARQRAMEVEANRLGENRIRVDEEEVKNREAQDAIRQAQMARVQQTTRAGELGNEMTQAKIDAIRAGMANDTTMSEASKQRLALELRQRELAIKSGEMDLTTKELTRPDAVELAKTKSATELAQARFGRDMAESMQGVAGRIGQGRADDALSSEFYRRVGTTDLAAFRQSAMDDWNNTIKTQLGGGTFNPTDTLGGNVQVDPRRAEFWVNKYVEPIIQSASVSPGEAKRAARALLEVMPFGGIKRREFDPITGFISRLASINDDSPEAKAFIDTMQRAYATLREIAGTP